MRRLIWGLGIGLAMCVAGWSTPVCTDQTASGVGGNKLSDYIALGSSGCLLNNILFYDFQYSYDLGTDSYYTSGPKGTGLAQPATQVYVTVDGLNTGFQFGGNWVVNHYQTGNLTLTFHVSAPSSLITTLQNTFVGGPAGTQNGGPTGTLSATCTGGSCATPTVFTAASVSIDGTQGVLTVTNTAVLNAKGSTSNSTNAYHLSIITDQFSATLPPPVATPEPTVYAMIGLGFCVFGYLRRRR
jgi:hypothetical protein